MVFLVLRRLPAVRLSIWDNLRPGDNPALYGDPSSVCLLMQACAFSALLPIECNVGSCISPADAVSVGSGTKNILFVMVEV